MDATPGRTGECDTATGTRGPRGVGKMVLRGTPKGESTRRREDELEGSRHLVHKSPHATRSESPIFGRLA